MLRSVLRVLYWMLLAVIAGPAVVAGALNAVAALPRADVERFAGGFLLSMTTMLAIGLVLSPLYVLLGVAWAALGRRLGRFETTRAWFTVAALLLALPAAIVVGIENRGAQPISSGLLALAAVWSGLVIPRLVSRTLRPGVFAAA